MQQISNLQFLCVRQRNIYTCGDIGGSWERKKSPQRVGWKVEAAGCCFISSWPELGPTFCPEAILSQWPTPLLLRSSAMYSQPAAMHHICQTHLCSWEISMDGWQRKELNIIFPWVFSAVATRKLRTASLCKFSRMSFFLRERSRWNGRVPFGCLFILCFWFNTREEVPSSYRFDDASHPN